jgi:hypothetical protein
MPRAVTPVVYPGFCISRQTLRSHNEGLSNDACTRYDPLMNARIFGGPKPSKAWRTKRKNRIKGIRRGRLLIHEAMAAVVPVKEVPIEPRTNLRRPKTAHRLTSDHKPRWALPRSTHAVGADSEGTCRPGSAKAFRRGYNCVVSADSIYPWRAVVVSYQEVFKANSRLMKRQAPQIVE